MYWVFCEWFMLVKFEWIYFVVVFVYYILNIVNLFLWIVMKSCCGNNESMVF